MGKIILFCSTIGVIWLLFLGYSVIRSHDDLAFNYSLNSNKKIIAYVSGANLSPSFPKAAPYYINRTLEHARMFSQNFLYLPMLLGVMGAVALFKNNRTPALFLTLLFFTNYLFFSYYAVSDYFTMPTPSYFIFSVFVGCGLASLAQQRSIGNGSMEYAGVVVCVFLVGVQLLLQFPARWERSNTIPVTNLIVPALEAFPHNAVVISRWERYAPMLYFQQIRNLRNDVTLVVSYDYLAQISIYALSDRPILIDNKDKELLERYQIKRYYRRWNMIVAPVGE